MSPEGRRRLVLVFLRITTVSAVIAGVLWGAWEISRMVGQKSHQAAHAKGELIKDIHLITDGALDKPWILRTLALPKDATLLELNLAQLRDRILAHGQVMHATIEREFPSTLVVRTTERSPVARIQAEIAGETEILLVARDGVVFSGAGFGPELLDTLPWLAGVKLVRSGTGFAPIAHMATAAELLAKAKLEAEHLYLTWQIVSLARLESDGVIEVQSKNDALRIRFATNQDYFGQLARLDWLIDDQQKRTGRPPARIDLTDSSQTVVTPTLVTNEVTRPAVFAPSSATAKPYTLPAFPNFSSTTKNKL